jgi:hypothetical protein
MRASPRKATFQSAIEASLLNRFEPPPNFPTELSKCMQIKKACRICRLVFVKQRRRESELFAYSLDINFL